MHHGGQQSYYYYWNQDWNRDAFEPISNFTFVPFAHKVYCNNEAYVQPLIREISHVWHQVFTWSYGNRLLRTNLGNVLIMIHTIIFYQEMHLKGHIENVSLFLRPQYVKQGDEIACINSFTFSGFKVWLYLYSQMISPVKQEPKHNRTQQNTKHGSFTYFFGCGCWEMARCYAVKQKFTHIFWYIHIYPDVQ